MVGPTSRENLLFQFVLQSPIQFFLSFLLPPVQHVQATGILNFLATKFETPEALTLLLRILEAVAHLFPTI